MTILTLPSGTTRSTRMPHEPRRIAHSAAGPNVAFLSVLLLWAPLACRPKAIFYPPSVIVCHRDVLGTVALEETSVVGDTPARLGSRMSGRSTGAFTAYGDEHGVDPVAATLTVEFLPSGPATHYLDTKSNVSIPQLCPRGEYVEVPGKLIAQVEVDGDKPLVVSWTEVILRAVGPNDSEISVPPTVWTSLPEPAWVRRAVELAHPGDGANSHPTSAEFRADGLVPLLAIRALLPPESFLTVYRPAPHDPTDPLP